MQFLLFVEKLTDFLIRTLIFNKEFNANED
jgi:hypothetical protein